MALSRPVTGEAVGPFPFTLFGSVEGDFRSPWVFSNRIYERTLTMGSYEVSLTTQHIGCPTTGLATDRGALIALSCGGDQINLLSYRKSSRLREASGWCLTRRFVSEQGKNLQWSA